jgi:hypothetical protein
LSSNISALVEEEFIVGKKLSELDDPFVLPIIDTYYIEWSPEVSEKLTEILTANDRENTCKDLKGSLMVFRDNYAKFSDTSNPQQRIDMILNDAKAKKIITEAEYGVMKGKDEGQVLVSLINLADDPSNLKRKNHLLGMTYWLPSQVDTANPKPVLVVQEMPFIDGGNCLGSSNNNKNRFIEQKAFQQDTNPCC